MEKPLKLLLGWIVIFLIGTSASASDFIQNDKFRCAFVPDIMLNKSAEAICSFKAEKVLSTNSLEHPQSEHCQTEKTTNASSWRELKVDLLSNSVTILEELFSHPETIKYAINSIAEKDGISVEAATQIFEEINLESYTFPIIRKTKVKDRNLVDTLTGKIYDHSSRKFANSINITFGEMGETNNMHIFGNNMQAIVTTYTTNGDSSWVKLRFGRCEMLN